MARNTKLKEAQKKVETALDKTNKSIEILGSHTGNLYDVLTEIQSKFDKIRNVPSDKKLEYTKLVQIRLSWKSEVDKIEEDYDAAVKKHAGSGLAGASLGVGVVAMGPTVAMGVATTFGVASTGTAISALSGAAATNAALAWLGGGALAAGGGGMAAGEAFLAMAGPVGWTIAGVSLLASVFFLHRAKEKTRRLEEIFTLISERDAKKYDLATVELNERIARIIDESEQLRKACEAIDLFGTDYLSMTENQQYALGSYVNLMKSATQLLVNPILGLQPKYTTADFLEFQSTHRFKENFEYEAYSYYDPDGFYKAHLNVSYSLANLFYKIDLSDDDIKLLYKSFRKNKDFLKNMGLKKDQFGKLMITIARDMLQWQKRKSLELPMESLCDDTD